MPSQIDTIGAMIDNGYVLHVYCETWGCPESKRVDLESLAARYGRQQRAMHWDLVKLPWRCQRCKGTKVSFRVQPGGVQYADRGQPRDEENIRHVHFRVDE